MLLAINGLIAALSVICLIAATYIPFNTLAFLSLSSFFVGVTYIEGRAKNALTVYFVTALLSLILPIDRMASLSFIFFFGYYPILKGLIEKLGSLFTEMILKIVFFIVISYMGVYGYYSLFGESLSEVLPLFIIPLGFILFMIAYDYALSLLFQFYMMKIKPKIRKSGGK